MVRINNRRFMESGKTDRGGGELVKAYRMGRNKRESRSQEQMEPLSQLWSAVG